MTSNAQARAGKEDEVTTTDAVDPVAEPDRAPTPDPAPDAEVPAQALPADDEGRPAEGRRARGRRLGALLVGVLALLLAGIVAVGTWLVVTWPEESPVTTADYVEALQAARSGVVDLTSFDHLTIDDDIAEIREITTGDLTEESVARLEDQRQELVDAGAIVSTEVVGAGVTESSASSATVVMVIETTSRGSASDQAGVTKYRIKVSLTKTDDRWLLSGITGV